jgi:hypothetical protein
MVEQWGTVPLAYLEQFSKFDYTYGYVGSEDFTMYPILPPGSFIQVDESRNKVVEGVWRSEVREADLLCRDPGGYTCCWCTLGREDLILQSHPLSPVAAQSGAHIASGSDWTGCRYRYEAWRVAGFPRFFSSPKRACSTELRCRVDPGPGSFGSSWLPFCDRFLK